MSRILTLVTNTYISKEAFYQYVVKSGGSKHELSENFSQGILKKGDACVWLYYRGEKHNFDDEELALLEAKYSISPETSVGVDLSNGKGSLKLALLFCRNFMEDFPDAALEDSYRNYFSLEELENFQ